MLKEFDPKSLKSKSLQELKALKAECEKQKAELLEYKASNRNWSEQSQDLLDDTVGFIADIEDAIDEAVENGNSYEVKKGLENHIHLLIHHGNSYSPTTGKLISEKYLQIFSYSEWSSFKNSFKRLGYTIDEVLYDPFNEATKYVK